MSRELTLVEKWLCIKAGKDPDTIKLCDVCVNCNYPGDCPKLGADVVMQDMVTGDL